MKRICPTAIDCVCDESGVLNTSSEAPDPLIFIGVGYTPTFADRPPTLGPTDAPAIAQDCFGTAFSVQSQQIADMLAEINSEFCTQTGGGAGGTPLSPGTNPSHPIPVRGGGGGGGGGGQKENPRPTTGGSQFSIAPLHGWCCADETIDNKHYIYSASSGRAGIDYTFTISSGSLPDGITLDKISLNSAQLKGTPDDQAPLGKYNFTISVSVPSTVPGNPGFVVATIVDTFEILGITNGLVPTIPRNQPFSYQLTAYGTSPISFLALDDDWPNGISMDAGGLITGTATNADCGKFFDPVIQITDSQGRSCAQEIILEVQGLIFLNAPPDGTLCVPYIDPTSGVDFQFLTDPSGAVFTGTVPKCLTLASDGTVHGTLKETVSGIFSINAQIPGSCGASERFFIDIDDPSGNYNCASAIKDLVWVTVAQIGHPIYQVFSLNAGTVDIQLQSFCASTDCGGCSGGQVIVQCFICNPCGGAYIPEFYATTECTGEKCVNPDNPSDVAYGSANIHVYFLANELVTEHAAADVTGGHTSNHTFGWANCLPPPGILQNLVTCGAVAFVQISMDVSSGGLGHAKLHLELRPPEPTNYCP